MVESACADDWRRVARMADEALAEMPAAFRAPRPDLAESYDDLRASAAKGAVEGAVEGR
jgi:hypothetical protein